MMNVSISEQLAIFSDALDRALFPVADCLGGAKESHRDGF
jgi:hypothetical protein